MNDEYYWLLAVIAVQLVLLVVLVYKYLMEAKKSEEHYEEAYHLKVSLDELYRWCSEFDMVQDVCAYINHHFCWTTFYFPDDDTVSNDISKFRDYLREKYKSTSNDLPLSDVVFDAESFSIHYSNVELVRHVLTPRSLTYSVKDKYGNDAGLINLHLNSHQCDIYLDNFPGQKKYFSTNIPFKTLAEFHSGISRTGLNIELKKPGMEVAKNVPIHQG